MNIAFIDGNHSKDNALFSQYVSSLNKKLLENNHTVSYFQLNSMNMKPCTGCWHCWWKTPGICSQKDDVEEILKSYITSDLVILSSPLVMGFPSALLKNFIDRLIPLFHPYIEIHNDECHHQWRYDSYPMMASLFQELPGNLKDDFIISSDYMKRTADHFRVPLLFSKKINDSQQEVLDAINAI